MIMTLLLILSLLWIGYRVFIEKEFLFWNWSDGKVGLTWNKEDNYGNGNR